MPNDPMKATVIAELKILLDDYLNKIATRIAEGNPGVEWTKDNAGQPSARGVTDGERVADISERREKVGHDEDAISMRRRIGKVTALIARDCVERRTGTPNAFISRARRLGRVMSQTRALEMAIKSFPREYAAFLKAQNAGEKLEPIFTSTAAKQSSSTYEQRRLQAISKGGVIS